MYFLIVEDTEKTAAQLQKGLSEISINTDIAADGLNAVAMARQKEYDLIILDLMLPGINGFEVIRRLREGGISTPIIVLTARDEVHDRITGLQLGADDYLVKPFSFGELCARIQALLRRGEVVKKDEVEVSDLRVNFFARKATRGEKILDLTPKEFALLSLLIRRAGEVVSKMVIAERIWNVGFEANLKIVDVKLGTLRAKVDGSFEKKLIHTVRGVGYVLEER